MTWQPGTLALVWWAIRRPIAAIRLIRTRTLWVALVVSTSLPLGLRRIALRPVIAVARSAARRRGDHPLAGPIQVMALNALERPAEALAAAEAIGRRGSQRTAVRLARVALALRDPRLADRLLAAHPESADDPGSAGLRGDVAFQMGRYRTAVSLLERSVRDDPDPRVQLRTLRLVKGELALLDPAWRPAFVGVARRPTPVRGRIVHLLTNSLPHRQAGYTVRAQQVARCQQAVGLDPRMVTRAGFPGTDGIVAATGCDVVDGVEYHRIRPALEPGLGVDRVAAVTADGLAGLIHDLSPSLLQPTTNYVNAQVALALGERFELPVVYEVRGFLEETWLSRMGAGAETADRYLATRAVETAAMRRATAIVTLSETMRVDILARGEIAADKVVVIPNGVDVERFRPGPRDEALASSLGIEPGEIVVGYVSSLVGYEGIGTLIEAVARLHASRRPVRLLLVGDGEDRPSLEAIAERTGLTADGTVIFAGRVPHRDIERYYRTIDIFVVPRTSDRVSQLVTPLKPYEAMAMARPVVVSAVAALLEIVSDGETGRTFRPDDPDDLARIIGELLDDPVQRARLGAAARGWVAENRTWAHNGARYLTLYRALGIV